jgi:exoribonuclease-2
MNSRQSRAHPPSATSEAGASARSTLQGIARRAMTARGLAPDFSQAVLAQLDGIGGAVLETQGPIRDQRRLPWCSIDNDDSEDLDQLSAAEALADGSVRLLVAVADVASTVGLGSPIDDHACQNTTSVYTAGQIFPMLPEKLSTNLTSLRAGADRLALVVEMTFDGHGSLLASDVHQALVRNRAKLAYPAVGSWLNGDAPAPAAVGAIAGLDENIRLQSAAARRLRDVRHASGALSLETIQIRPVFTGERLTALAPVRSNPATEMIEDLMIAANGVTARFLGARGLPSIRRVVRTPAHWDLIVALAVKASWTLPREPDARALEEFLLSARKADPSRFPDLSLSVIKLMGSGEYVVDRQGLSPPGHFSLAVKDYAHTTAPNRRFPDLLTQRLLKAALAETPPPYSGDQLEFLAAHCTLQENAAKKVERSVAKSAAAMLLRTRIGGLFDAIVTGVADKGTWVRIFDPPVEGRLVDGFAGLRVGDRIRARLVLADVDRGFIDFAALP